MRRTPALGFLFAALLCPAMVFAQDGAGKPAPRTRVRISGTGSDIVLEREPAPERKPSRAPENVSSPMDSAAELKASGASDQAVLSHLRAHADEISVVAAEDVRRLRKAGAGSDVLAWLSRNTALDIGETGEGHESPDYVVAAPQAADYGVGMYDAGYAVPWGGYGAPYAYSGGGRSFGNRFGRHGGRPAVPVHHGSPARSFSHGTHATGAGAIGGGGRVHRILP